MTKRPSLIQVETGCRDLESAESTHATRAVRANTPSRAPSIWKDTGASYRKSAGERGRPVRAGEISEMQRRPLPWEQYVSCRALGVEISPLRSTGNRLISFAKCRARGGSQFDSQWFNPYKEAMDFFRTPVVLATFLCCGIAVGQEVTYIANPGAGDATSGSDPDYGHHSALQELISLTDEQKKELSSINYALEDALFPITLEAFQKFWELGRAFRAEPPDEATVMMIAADFERIEARIAGVTAEHRKMARAILSWPQLIVLGSLESALKQYQAAQEAIQLNLIAEPDIFGPEGFIPFDGGIPLFPEARGADRGQPVTEATLDAIRLSQGLARLLARQKVGEKAVKRAR